jgi:2-(1,2-epoxy-1,2-dihydrophenyl)acetyl-CoA isomerase
VTTDLVLYKQEGAVATVTLNRPDRLNAMTAGLLDAALSTLEAAAADDAIRVLILTGAGRAFCVGGDLAAGLEGINGPPPLTSQAGRLRRFMRTSELLHDMPKVTIAAINGPCAGAGLAWACACDLRYASASAVFNTAFLTAAVSGDFGGTWTLPRIVGSAKARELYLLSDRINAEEALRIGLVSRLLPHDELLPHIRQIADRIASFAPLALQRVKENLNDAERLSFHEHLEAEAARHAFCCATRDATEAAEAFIQKRAAAFQGH